MNNVSVRLMDLPHTIRGCVVRNYDGDEFYTILINSRMSADMQKQAYIHEMEHIECDDFSCNLTADKIESIRHHD